MRQTRAELRVYEWPKWPIQDALRRQAPGSRARRWILAPAIARYRAALALDADNVTANRRLGQIDSIAGRYDAARATWRPPTARRPYQRATRQLLGESYALAGDAGRAVALWRTMDLTQGQLALREWWYGAIGETANQQRITQAIERLAPAMTLR